MTKKNDMYIFLKKIEAKKLMTFFLIDIFNYIDFNDYNYISRICKKRAAVILDVYDNVTDNRFNRYWFDFSKNNQKYFVKETNNVFVTHINILSNNETSNNLFKLAYLFKISYKERVEYAKSFLRKEIVNILKK